MNILVTGSEGFIASYLITKLQSQGHTIAGIARRKNTEKEYDYYSGDITNASFIQSVLKKTQPDCIYHLAAQSNIPYSFEHPEETIQNNVVATLHFLELLKGTKTHFISVGSSAEYGVTAKTNHSLPEDAPLSPLSPYGISKMTQGTLVQMYHRAYGVSCVHVRPFAVIGPGKKGDALSDFARGIVAIERGEQKNLAVGDLSSVRDFIDVRDAVCAFTLISQHIYSHDTYNICVGHAVSLSEMLDLLISHAKTKITVTINKSKKRPIDDRIIVGDPTRLFSLGFHPEIPLTQTVEDILEYWRAN